MLELQHISYEVEQDGADKGILHDVNLKIGERFVAITGPNGGGKSTLAKIIAGIYTPTTGRILLDGEDITGLNITERANKGISFAFQQPVRFKGLTVKDLITLASMSYLENYCRTLAADIPRLQNAYEIYLHTWKVFCLHAFSHPLIFNHLFFRPHSKPLEETVLRYYEVYPSQLAVTDGPVREMLLAGDLATRNQKVLAPLAQEGFFPAEHLPLINDLTICYFRKLLEECGAQAGTLANQQQTERMLAAIEFLTVNSK